MSMPRFKMRETEDLSQDPHWQDVTLPTSWQHLRPVPYKRDSLRQVSPRTTSLCLAREFSASHDKSPPRACSPPTSTEAWAMTRYESLGCECLHHNAWGLIPRAMQIHQLAAHASSWPQQEP
jgi:hypothetical protein